MIRLTEETIDVAAVIDAVRTAAAGAVVLFLGTVRQEGHGRKTVSLDYQAYSEMAERQLADLEAEARRRFGLCGCEIVHRLGHLPVGETSVAVAVSAAHRREAFEAGQWLIDRIKEVVPIWKQETYEDGTSQWIHPQAGAGVESETP